MKYKDSVGRVHDKPTDGINPSSHNGWLYTAVMKRLINSQPVVDNHAAEYCCYNLVRHPNVYKIEAPPISRDEILGLAYLGYLKPYHLKGWSFSPYSLPTFNPIQLLKEAISLVEWNDDGVGVPRAFLNGSSDMFFKPDKSLPYVRVTFPTDTNDLSFLTKVLEYADW